MSQPNYPLIVKSSLSALWGKHLPRAIIWIIVFFISFIVPQSGMRVIWILLGVAFVYYLGAFCFDYRKIVNTTYKIYTNKVEESSYAFKFLGVQNNVVNLDQIRQIQGYSNTYFDIWFFKCGGVTLTVSGDIEDFEFKNLRDPVAVKNTLEQICFGEEKTTTTDAFETK